jgi:hypothetical protein
VRTINFMIVNSSGRQQSPRTVHDHGLAGARGRGLIVWEGRERVSTQG